MRIIDDETILNLIQKSLNNLHSSGLISQKINVEMSTHLFGADSDIDSMSFVTLITEVEDAASEASGAELFIVLSDIEEMFPDAPGLSVEMLIAYIQSLIEV